MTCDTRHMQELMGIYYPRYAPKFTSASDDTHTSPTISHCLEILPYSCCNTTYLRQSHALAHYFEVHFGTALQDWNSDQAKKCTRFKDIGNLTIPVIRRVAFFLNTLNHPPKNPRMFRPAPHTKSPIDFSNPYSSCLAMAYDYIHILNSKPPQYTEFISVMKFHASINNMRLNSSCHWPCWAYFFYPSLLPKHALLKIPAPTYCQPLFRCQEPSCGKIYKQLAGLQYHIAHSHRKAPAKTIMLKCPFIPCKNTYQSTTGMCNHLKKFHLDPIHFEHDKLALPAKSIHSACPIHPCTFTCMNLAHLRNHIVKSHFWSSSDMI
ncbi:hypothetical protein DSO57_1010451 [Entomophthora muscae]|uniref:Uncharacterized protein n=1 Tax=Entomophthora muscae TaxID=34485 RepID=A0ACC2TTZ0_9FUNG|nr:hypothetical protein DSO57_1010451 [Entomophthora muscae]